MATRGEPVFVPAPELPPGRRSALVIATSRYDDAELRQLRSPVRDATDLATVLADPAIGGFTVDTLIDQTEGQLRRGIAAFLAERGTDETVCVYLSCHGLQDVRGRLYFAATDTIKKQPQFSAVRAADLLELLDDCRVRRQILILDCCFSGSFGDAKGDLDLEHQLAADSRGREVLTASRGSEYSFEGTLINGEVAGSVFTTGLVEGLRTGAAGTNGLGLITVDEAYQYAYRYVKNNNTGQTPQQWLYGGEGGIILARSTLGRVVAPAALPEDLANSLESRFPDIRIGAVNEIAKWLTDPDPARILTASRVLSEVAEHDTPRVARVAGSCLERSTPPATLPPPRAARTGKPGDVFAARPIPRTPTGLLADKRSVNSLAFSPDGALLASGGADNKARLWAAPAPNAMVRVLAPGGILNWVRAVAFSPDGGLLASGADDHKVRLWDVASGELVRTLSGHVGSQAWVRAVAFSPDGALLASGGDDHMVRLWDVRTGLQVELLEGHTKYVRCVAFSPDGAQVASGGNDNLVRLWDVATPLPGGRTQVQSRALRGHTDFVRSVAFSPDGTLLASGGLDHAVMLWDAATGAQARVLEGHAGGVRSVAFGPQGGILASGGDDHIIRLWNVSTGEAEWTLDGHRKAVNAIAFSPTEPLLATASADKTVRLWR